MCWMNVLIYRYMFRVLRSILAWITPLWRAVMWLQWARKGSLPCIRFLTGQGPAEGGENSHNKILNWYNSVRIKTVQISNHLIIQCQLKSQCNLSHHLILIHKNDSIKVILAEDSIADHFWGDSEVWFYLFLYYNEFTGCCYLLMKQMHSWEKEARWAKQHTIARSKTLIFDYDTIIKFGVFFFWGAGL